MFVKETGLGETLCTRFAKLCTEVSVCLRIGKRAGAGADEAEAGTGAAIDVAAVVVRT